MEINRKQRLLWIDIAKGICMVAVILGHFHKPEWGFLYSFHLTVFFILSGYTMKEEPVTKEYLKGKFRRLMIPYFLTCLAVAVMEVLNSVVITHDSSIVTVTAILYRNLRKMFFASGGVRYFGNLDFGKGIGAIWFLPAMFFTMLITQLLVNRCKTRKMQWAGALIISAVAAASAKITWLPFSVQAGAFAVPFVLFGILLRERRILEEKLKWWHYAVLAVLFAAGCLSGYAEEFYMVSCTAKDWLLTPLFAICGSMVIIGIARWIKHCPPLEFVGKNSLLFLCVHLVEMNTCYRYYEIIRQLFSLPDNYYITFLMKLLLISAVVGLIVLFQKWSGRKPKPQVTAAENRDMSIDIMRAMLIVLMIVGHVPISRDLRNVIYSFHMMAFVMISGYFYRPNIPLVDNLKKTVKTLAPYAVFAVLYMIVSHRGWYNELLTVAAGISYTKMLLTDIPTVGPVYFILLLFVTKLLYIGVDRIRNEVIKNGVVIGLFALSIWLGNEGIWLPWSVDCALFAVMFYHIAYYLRKFKVLKMCREMPFLYFPLSCLWAYMIYNEPMELSVRRYANAGLTVIGVVAAFVVVYLMCGYLSTHLPRKATGVISLIGQSTPQILVLHTLFGSAVIRFVNDRLGMNSANIFCLAVSVTVQVIAGIVIFAINRAAKKRIKEFRHQRSVMR